MRNVERKMAMRPFRFGLVNLQMLPEHEWIQHVQRAEELNYDTFLICDRLIPEPFGDQYAPLIALTVAARETQRIRLGTQVLANDFRHPVALAKEAATLDIFSQGRFELGLGAGWLRAEYQAAGIDYDQPSVRIQRLEEGIEVIKQIFQEQPASFTGEHYELRDLEGQPKPVQSPGPPLFLGGSKPKMLKLAGREADIVSLLPFSVSSGTIDANADDAGPEATRQKLDWIREGAGARFSDIEIATLPTIQITDDSERAIDEMIATSGWGNTSHDDVRAMPSVLVGTTDEIADQLIKRRDEYGISYYVVTDYQMEEFAPVIERIHSLAGAVV